MECASTTGVRCVAILLSAWVGSASADPTVDAPTAESVRGAPRPGQESGRLDVPRGDSAVREVARGILWGPRAALMLSVQPVRGLLYAQDRYDLAGSAISLFSTDDRKFAMFPTALFETGFGLNAGARSFIKDLVAPGDRYDLRAGIGGADRWQVVGKAQLDRHHRGRVAMSLEARVARRDNDRYYGIGDAGTEDSLYRTAITRAIARARIRLPASVALTGTGAVVDKDVTPTDPAMLAPTTEALYGELELTRDTRRRADAEDAHGVRSTGSLALGFAGREHELRDGRGWFRVGFDLQQFVRLESGPRAFEFRLYADAVVGGPSELPFTELPRLGGPSMLRGYPADRFRDRLAVVGQVSYVWAAASWLSPVIFVDAGRVFAKLGDLSVTDPRVGYGAALELYGRGGLAMRFEIASSIDGGLFGYIALNPAYDTRVERY
jgi:hypothetical protein